MMHHAELLRACGVRERFEAKDYSHALSQLHARVGTTSLCGADLEGALALVRAYVELGCPEKLVVNTLLPATLVYFDDIPWEPTSLALSLVHAQISNSDARILSCLSRRALAIGAASVSPDVFGMFEAPRPAEQTHDAVA